MIIHTEAPSLNSCSPLEGKPPSAKPRLLIADDHPLWLDRVTDLLKSSFDLVGAANNGQTLVGEARRLQPDLIVLDIAMPILNGIEAAHEIHATRPDIKLVFLTVHEGPEYISACFAEGGLGYVKKARLKRDLLVAIREALLGRAFISPSVAS